MSKGTTRRAIRIDDALWQALQDRAEAEGLNASAVVRELIQEWLNKERT